MAERNRGRGYFLPFWETLSLTTFLLYHTFGKKTGDSLDENDTIKRHLLYRCTHVLATITCAFARDSNGGSLWMLHWEIVQIYPLIPANCAMYTRLQIVFHWQIP